MGIRIDEPNPGKTIKHNRSNKTKVLKLLVVKKGEFAGVKIVSFSVWFFLKWHVVIVIITKIVHRTSKSFICTWVWQGRSSEGVIVGGFIHFRMKLKRRI